MATDRDAVGEHNWSGPVDPTDQRRKIVAHVGSPLEPLRGSLVVELLDGFGTTVLVLEEMGIR